ncbi:DUF4157 domain-containing protein [Cereibacter sphaeroides]|uniref:eCIS core domain-containing protein n=2 Tax=Cereibacter sphaeroides TaxID=1063 RepID=UPI001F1BCC26|nr:DUF4157 domain-containing protein [Cereibacter sphaeroides]MCE6968433.1 DUF4157 domain-containing protein [Cereibacter sphaeroides]
MGTMISSSVHGVRNIRLREQFIAKLLLAQHSTSQVRHNAAEGAGGLPLSEAEPPVDSRQRSGNSSLTGPAGPGHLVGAAAMRRTGRCLILLLLMNLTPPGAVAQGAGSLSGTGETADSLARALALAGTEQAVTLLAASIDDARRQAIAEGVAEIPGAIRAQLEGMVPQVDLEAVRWRVGGGSELSLQRNAILHGGASAITLVDVVVFADEGDALANATLWAHELRHVAQYREWGLMEFSRRYVTDHETVEADAVAFAAGVRSRSLPQGALRPPPPRPDLR